MCIRPSQPCHSFQHGLWWITFKSDSNLARRLLLRGPLGRRRSFLCRASNCWPPRWPCPERDPGIRAAISTIVWKNERILVISTTVIKNLPQICQWCPLCVGYLQDHFYYFFFLFLNTRPHQVRCGDRYQAVKAGPEAPVSEDTAQVFCVHRESFLRVPTAPRLSASSRNYYFFFERLSHCGILCNKKCPLRLMTFSLSVLEGVLIHDGPLIQEVE